MGRGREDADDGVVLLHRHARTALAAAMLGPIGVQRRPLDVAAVGHGDDHVLARDQVLVFQFIVALADQGPARNRELLAHDQQVLADHRQDVGAVAQQGQVALDGVGQAARLAEDVVAAQAGQTGQGQAKDGAGLFVGQVQLVAVDQHGARVGDQLDQGDHVAHRPALACSRSRASAGSAELRMMWMTSSILATARPDRPARGRGRGPWPVRT
jgi:hypothetical protein